MGTEGSLVDPVLNREAGDLVRQSSGIDTRSERITTPRTTLRVQTPSHPERRSRAPEVTGGPDWLVGAPPGTRTQNLRIKSPLLCQIELEARPAGQPSLSSS
jgi:hypothetical protein